MLTCPWRGWSFLTNHARVLLCIAHDPGVRLRDIGSDAGHHRAQRLWHRHRPHRSRLRGEEREEKDGRRNRYQIQTHLPLREAISRDRTIGEVLDLLVDTNTRTQPREGHG